MKNEKFCFSKGTGLIALVGVVLVAAALLMGGLSSKSTSTSTRASGTSGYDCGATGIAGGVSGRKYYAKYVGNKVQYFKDAETRFPVEGGAIGTYCKLVTATDTTCRNVQMEESSCQKPLYKKGDADEFYSNSSCLGKIVKEDGTVQVSADLQTSGTGYCKSSGATKLLFNCPSPNEDKTFYVMNGKYYKDAGLSLDVTRFGVGNLCKVLNDSPISLSKILPIKCGTSTQRTIYQDVADDTQYFDMNGTYTGDTNGYCDTSFNGSLSTYLSTNNAQVKCSKYVSGGDDDVAMRYTGSSYLPGTTGAVGLRIMTPQQVCRKTVVTSTCYNYALAAGKKATNSIDKFKTNDEMAFTKIDGSTAITDLNTYCGFTEADGITSATLEFNSNL